MASPEEKLVFSEWKYRHYFVKNKNLHVNCTLCPRAKFLSTSVVSNSNLMRHLSAVHASTKLVAKNSVVDSVDDDSRNNMSSANKEGHRAIQAAKAGFLCSSFKKTCDTD